MAKESTSRVPEEAQGNDLPLTSYRVLNLTDERGCFCPWILSEYGADTIVIEPPRGSTARNAWPLFDKKLNESLFWLHYYQNQRGITLNLETVDGQKIFKELVQKTHFVVESFPAGYLDKLGLGYAALSEINPSIIMTSVTAYGQNGPHKDWKASDLAIAAMGVQMYVTGDADRQPLRVGADQGYLVASAYAATGTMLAHYHRLLTGEGQYVDVAAQEVIELTTELPYVWWDLQKHIQSRTGGQRSYQGIVIRTVWKARDGYVAWRLYTDRMGWRTNNVAKWMKDLAAKGELEDEEELREIMDKDWSACNRNDMTPEEWEHYKALFWRFFAQRPKAEFEEQALKRGFIGFRLASPSDSLESPQLQARDFWRYVTYPELGGVTIAHPGRIYRSETLPWVTPRHAPSLGEHNVEIYQGELGFSNRQMSILKQGNVI